MINFTIEHLDDFSVAGCQFITVDAYKTKDYTAVPFYDRCHFTACELPNPNKDTLRMYKTLYVVNEETLCFPETSYKMLIGIHADFFVAIHKLSQYWLWLGLNRKISENPDKPTTYKNKSVYLHRVRLTGRKSYR